MDPLEERISRVNGGRILDVATGTGEFLKWLGQSFESFSEGIGIDPAVDRIEAAAKEPDGRFSFEVMNAEQMEFEDASFDTVAIRHSLHHLRNIEPVLDEMMRVLKPGGLMIVGEVIQDPATVKPNSQRHLHHWWGRVDQTRGVPHFETFTRDEVRAMIRRLHLTDEDVLEFFEEASEEEVAEELQSMLKHSEEVVRKLREAGDQPELAEEGERLVKLYREQGYEDEKVLYVLGRKAVK